MKITHRYLSAHVALFSAVGLAIASFILNQYKIDTSILWYIAQCLVYAASMFGVSLAIDTMRRIVKSNSPSTNETNN